MAAKIFALLAILALSFSAATAFVIPQVPLSAAIIPQFFPSVTGVGSTHSIVQSYRQQHAFAAGIPPFLSVMLQQPFAFPQLPYIYNQLAIPQFPYLYNQLAFQQLPYLYNQLAVQQFPYLYNQLAIQQLPYLYNQLAIQQVPYLYNQLAIANTANFLSFNQLAFRNPATFWQQPIVGGTYF